MHNALPFIGKQEILELKHEKEGVEKCFRDHRDAAKNAMQEKGIPCVFCIFQIKRNVIVSSKLIVTFCRFIYVENMPIIRILIVHYNLILSWSICILA